MKEIKTTEMEVLLNKGRRTGNTKRQIDAAIQYLFNGYIVKCIDHAHEDIDTANKYLFMGVLRRLLSEHSSIIIEGAVFADYNNYRIAIQKDLMGFQRCEKDDIYQTPIGLK